MHFMFRKLALPVLEDDLKTPLPRKVMLEDGTSVLYITAIKLDSTLICYVSLFSRPLSPL